MVTSKFEAKMTELGKRFDTWYEDFFKPGALGARIVNFFWWVFGICLALVMIIFIWGMGEKGVKKARSAYDHVPSVIIIQTK